MEANRKTDSKPLVEPKKKEPKEKNDRYSTNNAEFDSYPTYDEKVNAAVQAVLTKGEGLTNHFQFMLELKDTVMCQICKLPMIDTAVLICGHTFCNFCAKSWLSQIKSCPKCNNPCHDVKVEKIYDIDCMTEVCYDEIRSIFGKKEKVSHHEPKVRYFESQEEAQSQLHGPNLKELPTWEQRQRLMTLRRDYTEQNPLPLPDTKGLSMLKKVARMSLQCERNMLSRMKMLYALALMIIFLAIFAFPINLGSRLVSAFISVATIVYLIMHCWWELFENPPFNGSIWNMFFQHAQSEETREIRFVRIEALLRYMINRLGVDEFMRLYGEAPNQQSDNSDSDEDTIEDISNTLPNNNGLSIDGHNSDGVVNNDGLQNDILSSDTVNNYDTMKSQGTNDYGDNALSY